MQLLLNPFISKVHCNKVLMDPLASSRHGHPVSGIVVQFAFITVDQVKYVCLGNVSFTIETVLFSFSSTMSPFKAFLCLNNIWSVALEWFSYLIVLNKQVMAFISSLTFNPYLCFGKLKTKYGPRQRNEVWNLLHYVCSAWDTCGLHGAV